MLAADRREPLDDGAHGLVQHDTTGLVTRCERSPISVDPKAQLIRTEDCGHPSRLPAHWTHLRNSRKLLRNMRKRRAIDALISGVRQGVLRLTYGQPERWWYLSELAGELGTTPSSIQRELESLARTGILAMRREGRRTYYRAEENNAIFPELRSIVDKTLGISDQVRSAIEPLKRRIAVAFLYGSVVRHEDRATSDIDLFVVGQAGLAALAPIASKLERRFRRAVNPTVMTPAELRKRHAASDHFVTSVLQGKKEFLIGDEQALEKITD